jgi:adenine-specific DNA-methyltransferase
MSGSPMKAQVVEGDCLTVLGAVPSASVRLVVTSPPYNVGKEYEQRKSLDEYLVGQEAVVKELTRTLMDGGSLCWQSGVCVEAGEVLPLDALMLPILRAAGLKIRNRIVWTFGHGLHASKRYSGRHETILWATKGDGYLFNLDAVRVPQLYPNKRHYKGPKKGQLSGNPLGKNPGDVWDIPNVKAHHPEKTAHPCQFPEELVERLVASLSNPGDLVLDPYAGSGTVGIVAQRNNRRAMLIELNAGYAEIARERCRPDLLVAA